MTAAVPPAPAAAAGLPLLPASRAVAALTWLCRRTVGGARL
jgi:hypothetical protein